MGRYSDRCISSDVGWLEIHSNCRTFRLEPMGGCEVDSESQSGGPWAIEDHSRPGRPSQFDAKVLMELDEALSKPPQDYGLSRNRWDGVVVVEYLKRFHYIKIQVRHAQRMIKRLGYSLRRPRYQYVQATDEGVAEFQEEVKKTPSRPRK